MSVMKITSENFDQEVLKSEKPVLLDFFATWCGPCRMVGPFIDQIAEEKNDIKVGKIDVDQEGDLASRFQIFSIPTLIVMKDGEVLQKATGARSKDEILAMLP